MGFAGRQYSCVYRTMLVNFYCRLYRFLSQHPLVTFGAILTFGLILRLVHWYGNPVAVRDELYYIGKAAGGVYLQSIAANATVHPPLPEAYLSALYEFFSTASNSQRLTIARLSILWIGISGIIPFYFIGKILFERRAYAFCLMFFATVQPALVEYSVTFLRESFSAPLSALVLWLLLECTLRPVGWKYGLLGAAAGIAALCRYEMVEWMIYVSIVLLCPFLSHQCKWRCRFYNLGTAVSIFALIYFFVPILFGQTWNSQIRFIIIILRRLIR